MTLRRLVLVFLVILILVLAKPKWVWGEIRRIRSQWDTILRLLVVVVVVYLLYGVYTVWVTEPAWWPFW